MSTTHEFLPGRHLGADTAPLLLAGPCAIEGEQTIDLALKIQEALDGTGVIDLPGDRWVRTYEEADVVQLLEDAGLAVEQVVATHYMTDGPLERCAPESLDLAAILRWEETCRGHRIWGPLNRAWTFTARRP